VCVFVETLKALNRITPTEFIAAKNLEFESKNKNLY
jgi:hypothetical protein